MSNLHIFQHSVCIYVLLEVFNMYIVFPESIRQNVWILPEAPPESAVSKKNT